jgi:hypothetical protein
MVSRGAVAIFASTVFRVTNYCISQPTCDSRASFPLAAFSIHTFSLKLIMASDFCLRHLQLHNPDRSGTIKEI